MQFERGFFRVAVCAVVLLGLSTIASANIIGTGCVVSGSASAGQIAPNSITAFMNLCTGAAGTGVTVVGGEYTFSAPDTLTMNLGPNTTPNTGQELITAVGGTLLTNPTGGANFSPATSGNAGQGGDSTIWDLHETNIAPGTYTVSLTHDDGIVLVLNHAGTSTIEINAPDQTVAITSTSPSFTVAAGDTIDLFYDQCCQFPAVLEGTMPAEITSAVPEPASIMLLGTGILGIAALVRRKRSSLS